MKITKRDRERVAEMLSMLACQASGWFLTTHNIKGFARRHLDVGRQAVHQALTYWGDLNWRAGYAEAEAMIRTGWTP